MKKKSLEVIASASGLATDDLREVTAALERLIERRVAKQIPPPSATRLVIETRRTRVATLQLELVKCGKWACKACKMGPAHGPYWYAYWKHEGRTRTKYIGKKLPESFTAYAKNPESEEYIGQVFAVPRSYVTRRKPKSKRLHKTVKRPARKARAAPQNPSALT